MKSQEPERLEDDQGRGASWGAGRQTETSLEQPKPAGQQLAGQPTAEPGGGGGPGTEGSARGSPQQWASVLPGLINKQAWGEHTFFLREM